MDISYRVAGIDVHKKMLAVAIADPAATGEFRFERRKFGLSFNSSAKCFGPC
jgi:hypothetical protein